MAQSGMPKLIYPTASVRTHSTERIGVAVVSGVVTPGAVRQIVGDSGRWGTTGEALANLVIYEGAAMALPLDALLHEATAAKQPMRASIPPAALVVSADQRQMFGDYCAAMGQRGALIAAFTCQTEARQWVERQAQVRAHWLALRRGLRSGS